MKQLLVSVLFLLQISFCLGQYGETISSGRPGQAIAPLTPGSGVLQIETGFDYSGAKILTTYQGQEIDLLAQQSYSNSTLIRYGLSEKFELHTAFSFRKDNIDLGFPDTSFSYGGLSLLALGWRYNIWQGSGKQPSLAMMFSVKLNAVDSNYKSEGAAPQFILASSNPLGFADLTINLGVDWDGTTREATGLYILNLARGVTDNIGVFVEAYGTFTVDGYDLRFDAGASLLLNANMQLDILGGYGSNDDLTDFFASIGFSWRIGKSRALTTETPAE